MVSYRKLPSLLILRAFIVNDTKSFGVLSLGGANGEKADGNEQLYGLEYVVSKTLMVIGSICYEP